MRRFLPPTPNTRVRQPQSEAAKSTRSRSCGCVSDSQRCWSSRGRTGKHGTLRGGSRCDGGQGGHGRCSVERCFLKFHRSRGVSSIGGFVCHPVEWQLGSLSTARTRTRVDGHNGHNGHNGREATGGGAGRGGSVKRQCCVRHGGLRCPELQYRIGFHHDGFRPAG